MARIPIRTKPGEPIANESTFANQYQNEPRLRDLNFKVAPEFHKEFKMAATAAGMSMKELLEESFSAWLSKRRR